MNDYYWILDTLIRAELDRKQTVAIYPFGRVGLQAADILLHRYGIKGVIIDNGLVKYNPEIIDINEFKKIDKANITIILCAANVDLNRELLNDLRNKNVKARIKNILEVLLIPHPEKMSYFKKLKKLFQVKKVETYKLVRIGGKNDGGYIMLDNFKDCNIAYSFGIGEDISWDEGMVHRGMDVYCYDHTIERLPKANNKLKFIKIGISEVDCPAANLLTMDSILQSNNHQDNKCLILKMDVEGAEWKFINSVSSETLKQFSQMTFEFHGITNMEYRENIITALEKINKTHQAVWVHANNSGGAEKAGNIVMPDLLEVTYVRRGSYTFLQTEYNCPLDIDAPNLSNRFDIELINWGS